MEFIKNKSTIFVLDTNILLNMGRLPLHSGEHFLNLLKSVEDRIWIPRQVLKEFEKNKRHVFGDIPKRYMKIKSELKNRNQEFIKSIEKTLSNPMDLNYLGVEELNMSILDKVTEISKIIKNFGLVEEDKIKQGQHETFQNNLFEFVDNLKVGKEISISERLRILSEGELRYRYQIPPGFKDEQKDKKNVNPQEKFGDLFLWKEILALPEKKVFPSLTDIVFITNDQKQDWFLNNKIHPYLAQEFKDKWKNIELHFIKGADFYKIFSELTNTFELGIFVNMYGLQNIINNSVNQKILDESLMKKMEELEGKSDEYFFEYIEYLDFNIDSQKIFDFKDKNDELILKYKLQITVNNLLHYADFKMNDLGETREFVGTTEYTKNAIVNVELILKYDKYLKQYINEKLEVIDIILETVN